MTGICTRIAAHMPPQRLAGIGARLLCPPWRSRSPPELSAFLHATSDFVYRISVRQPRALTCPASSVMHLLSSVSWCRSTAASRYPSASRTSTSESAPAKCGRPPAAPPPAPPPAAPACCCCCPCAAPPLMLFPLSCTPAPPVAPPVRLGEDGAFSVPPPFTTPGPNPNPAPAPDPIPAATAAAATPAAGASVPYGALCGLGCCCASRCDRSSAICCSTHSRTAMASRRVVDTASG